jgi:hypothetical protein
VRDTINHTSRSRFNGWNNSSAPPECASLQGGPEATVVRRRRSVRAESEAAACAVRSSPRLLPPCAAPRRVASVCEISPCRWSAAGCRCRLLLLLLLSQPTRCSTLHCTMGATRRQHASQPSGRRMAGAHGAPLTSTGKPAGGGRPWPFPCGLFRPTAASSSRYQWRRHSRIRRGGEDVRAPRLPLSRCPRHASFC